MAHEKGKRQFLEVVFKKELEEIGKRRRALNSEKPELENDVLPCTRHGLVGLALSGGGIRSATLCLGALQALAKHGILKSVDYLSTVSGGGFIGSCLSSVMNKTGSEPQGEAFPFGHAAGEEEHAAVRHLRNSSNYLAPGGLLDKIRIPMVVLRGILINLFMFVPILVLAVFVTEVVYVVGHYGNIRAFYKVIPLLSILYFLFQVIRYPFVVRLREGANAWSWTIRDSYGRMLSKQLLALIILISVVPLFLWIVGEAIDLSWERLRESLPIDHPFAVQHLWKWLGAVGILLLFMLAGTASEKISRASKKISTISSKLLLYALGILGPGILFGAYLVLCVLQISSPVLGSYTSDPDSAEAIANNADATVKIEILKAAAARTEAVAIADALIRTFRQKEIILSKRASVTKESPVVWFPNTPLEINVRHPQWVIEDVENGRRYTVRMENGENGFDLTLYPGWRSIIDGWADVIYMALGLLVFLLNWFLLDVNISASHGFFRDRLSRAYLIRENRDEEEAILFTDEQKLSELNAEGTKAPYHLINVSLNLHGSKDPNVRGRNADVLTFSKHHTGSVRSEYCQTTTLEELNGHLNLGTALAISGAAAVPNMGLFTIKPLVFIMTLLNIRLGYWIPNPQKVNQGQHPKRGPGPRYLLKESLGEIDALGDFLNVSDGGHLENLGVYELLRRRCELIISVDSGTDPELKCSDLTKIIRYARIDMGIEISIEKDDLDAFNLTGGEFCARHWVSGVIDYGVDGIGYLLYLKSSVTGDENPYVLDYKAQAPAFPHQSTADQFFDETQFEAYRALGFHLTNRFLDSDEARIVKECC